MMISVKVNASRKYEIRIGSGLLAQAGEFAAGLFRGRKALIVSDDVVAPLYADTLEASLLKGGFACERIVFPHGEQIKKPENALGIINFLADAEYTRGDCVVALGGGTVGDLAGFAASVYLRGIGLLQMPTTLLAAVDSSVGGKTAVNLTVGKNLLGSFYQPHMVVCDTDVLASLPVGRFAEGAAEIIKYGVIADRVLFDNLRDDLLNKPGEVIASCVQIKRDVVEKDELDTGLRQLLNFGHTPAHAIEKLSNFGHTHGEAVAVGMVIMANAAAKMGFCEPEVPQKIRELVKACGLPDHCEYTAAQLAGAALADKKRQGGKIALVFPEAIGKAFYRDFPVEQLEEIFTLGVQE